MTRTNTTPLRTVHLLDDVNLGGVTRGLAVFEIPSLAARMENRVVEVDPASPLAPCLDADLILVHFPPRWRALPYLAMLRLRNPGARIIQVEHSYTRAWAARHVGKPGRFRALLRLWCEACDEIVCVSQGQGRWLQEAAGLELPPTVIYPWGGDHGLYAVEPARPRAQGPLRLGAYGRFAEQKGFDLLLEAMHLLAHDHYTLDLGGFGPDEAMLRERAQGLDNVRFTGKVADLPAFMADLDVLVIPSRWEAFGQVGAECKMAGRATLFSDVDGLPEQAPDPAWIVDCSSPETIALAIAAIDPLEVGAAGALNRTDMHGARQARIDGWSAVLDRGETHRLRLGARPRRIPFRLAGQPA